MLSIVKIMMINEFLGDTYRQLTSSAGHFLLSSHFL